MSSRLIVAFKTRESPPPYLEFLSLASNNEVVDSSIATIVDAIEDFPIRKEVLSYLGKGGWREHLVAAIVALLLKDKEDFSEGLWQAFDRGSWVQPQLAVTAFFTDPSFSENAVTRLRTGCLVLRADKNWWQKHVSRYIRRGPADKAESSAKGAASLFAVCGWIRTLEAEVLSLSSSRTLSQLLSADRDRSGEIADMWRRNIEAAFQRFGKSLRRREDGPAKAV